MYWIYMGKPLYKRDLKSIGFVYKITNNLTGEFYIGKKNFLTNRKNHKGFHEIKESNWRDYWGSSKVLKEQIEKDGKKNFTREILRFCSNDKELTYWEAKYQFMLGVLEKESSYNKTILGRVFKEDDKTF